MTIRIFDQPRRARSDVSVPGQAIILLAATGLLTLGVLLPVPVLRIAVVLPLALLVPGYAIITAAFGFQERFDTVPTAALSALLSMSSYMAVGLGLYVASIPLSTASVLAGTDGLIVLLVAAAVLRTRLGVPSAWPITALDVVVPRRSAWNRARAGVFFVGAVSVVAVAVVVAMNLLPKPVDAPFTQFYLAGSSSHISSVVRVRPDHELVVALGITNQTHRPQTYHVAPLLDNGLRWYGRTVVLPASHTWMGSISGYVPVGGCVHRLSINLYMRRHAGVLARLILWVGGTPGRRASCTSGKVAATP